MSKLLVATLLIGLLFALSGCRGTVPPSGSETGTPIAAATATPGSTASPHPMPTPGPTVATWLNSCTLLSSRDAASFFTTAEVEGPTHQRSQVGHTIFSTEPISATEASCVYYVFNHPGSADMKLLQINYWLDVPAQTTTAAWDRIWTDAQSGTAQTVSDIGDGAFYKDGRLSFKKGNVYVTIEVTSAGQNFTVVPGSAEQLDLERQVALDMLPNMD